MRVSTIEVIHEICVKSLILLLKSKNKEVKIKK